MVTKEEDKAMSKSDGDFNKRYKGADVIIIDCITLQLQKNPCKKSHRLIILN